MNRGLGAVALGAAAMYLLDKDHGRRRRALVRDRLVYWGNRTMDALEATARDMRNRSMGIMAESRGLLRSHDVDDSVLTETIRSRIGGVITHPGSIDVRADMGRVTLRGPILSYEVDRLIRAARGIKGVRSLDPQLEIHDQPGDVPGLQGTGMPRRGGGKFELSQRRWSPTARVLTGALGARLFMRGVRNPSFVNTTLGLAGLGLLTRAATNLDVKRLIGVGAGRGAVTVHKTININAPVEDVYAFWTDYENYPQFMANVREVRRIDGDTTRWVVTGPAGVSVTWEAVETKEIPDNLIAWKTAGGSAIGHSGQVRFIPTADGWTTIEVHLSYNPVAGLLGHLVASLFGADPKAKLDEDLMRMKAMIETGRVPSNAAADRY